MRVRLLAVVVLLSTIAFADPSPTMRYLMDQSVSSLEFGAFLLERHLEALTWNPDIDFIQPRTQIGRVSYDWEKNQLQLNVTVYPVYATFTKSTPKDVCGSLMRQLKSGFGVGPESQVVRQAMRDAFGLATYFTPRFFKNPNVPKTLADDLEAITVFQLDVMASKTNRALFSKMMTCSSDATSSETRYFITE